MKLENPIKLLLVLVSANALFFAAIAFLIKSSSSSADEKMHLILLCAVGFTLASVAAIFAGKRLLKNFVEPLEESASRMNAVLDTDSKSSSLKDLCNALITRLETATQRERLIADYSSDLLFCLDGERKILDLNAQAESVLEYPPITLLATPIDVVVFKEDINDQLLYFEACKIQEQQKFLETRVMSRTGKVLDLEWQVEWSQKLSQYYCLARNITERKEAQRLKAEITAMVGHDLRAPASSLSFLLQNLKAGTFGNLPAEAVEKVNRASDNVETMLKLINQLLDAEKLDGGQMEVELKIIPLSELYETCTDLLSDLASRKSITITFPEESSSMVMADFDRCVQILCNLLSNAIKWSPENSRVEISEAQEGKSICIKVKDCGPGIEKERQESIFHRFKSVDTRADKSLASTGLGLYIAKKLIELQNGNISVESEPGHGSTFTICLKRVREVDLPGYLD